MRLAIVKYKTSAIQYVDKYLSNNSYHYFVKGIDIFGRISQPSNQKSITTNAVTEYNAPLNLHAEFRPLRGRIAAVSDQSESYRLETDISYQPGLSRALLGYDVVVTREDNTTSEIVRQQFEIEIAEDSANRLLLIVQKVPFSQLAPRQGDILSISLDHQYKFRWSWSGMQQLYFPSITGFRLKKARSFHRSRILNEISAPISNVEYITDRELTLTVVGNENLRANELAGENCLIGSHQFKILSHESGKDPQYRLYYSGMPAVPDQVA